MTAPFDVTPFLRQDEGQYFDRKSLFEGEPGSKRPRDRRTVRDQVAEYVAAFANAEGGVLILGLEDDGTPTGHGYPDDAVRAILETPKSRLRPPQPEGFVVEHTGVALLVFEVPAADGPVMVDGNGFPLRMGDRTVKASETQIQALKLRGMVESWEARPSALRVPDLDSALLARARSGSGLSALSDEDYLLKRKLAERRGKALVLRRAAELLFARDGSDHPNAGVRVLRVVGTERRLGAEHNVEERPRIEGNLASVVEESGRVVGGLLRRPSRLVGHRFRETPEYPEFSWKEALLNAVAHRDYSIEGRTTEVWLYDDRMEVISPGGLVPEVSLEALRAHERVHASRNPRLVRALVDLGYMRDQGEGIPRVFAEMEGLFLPEPVLDADARQFRLILRNTPTLTAADRQLVAALGGEELSDQEFRAVLEASRHGRIDNARMRQISGLDVLGASALLRKLRDRELLTLHPLGSQSYYDLGPRLRAAGTTAVESPSDRGELDPDRGELTSDGETDRGELDPDRGELAPEGEANRGELPPTVRAAIQALGPRPRKDKLRQVILLLGSVRAFRAAELAALVGFNDVGKLVERHLKPLVDQGALARTYPDAPSHPDQAYRTVGPVQMDIPTEDGDGGDE
jgi:ATP-dependent DNA helicase RecG